MHLDCEHEQLGIESRSTSDGVGDFSIAISTDARNINMPGRHIVSIDDACDIEQHGVGGSSFVTSHGVGGPSLATITRADSARRIARPSAGETTGKANLTSLAAPSLRWPWETVTLAASARKTADATTRRPTPSTSPGLGGARDEQARAVGHLGKLHTPDRTRRR